LIWFASPGPDGDTSAKNFIRGVIKALDLDPQPIAPISISMPLLTTKDANFSVIKNLYSMMNLLTTDWPEGNDFDGHQHVLI
jgi:hypothetical protein